MTCLTRVADDAVALADGVVEAGQLLAAHGGHDPEAELADFDWDKLACLTMGLCGWSMVPRYVQGLSKVPPGHGEGSTTEELYLGGLWPTPKHPTSDIQHLAANLEPRTFGRRQ